MDMLCWVLAFCVREWRLLVFRVFLGATMSAAERRIESPLIDLLAGGISWSPLILGDLLLTIYCELGHLLCIAVYRYCDRGHLLRIAVYVNLRISLSGHTAPAESLAFDSTEALVLGGASSGPTIMSKSFCEMDSDAKLLTKLNSVLRRIDLVCKLCAPAVLGFIVSFVSLKASTIFLALWNVFSVCLEYWLFSSIYNGIPVLHMKDRRRKVIPYSDPEPSTYLSKKNSNLPVDDGSDISSPETEALGCFSILPCLWLQIFN